jgi:hypothetical protein
MQALRIRVAVLVLALVCAGAGGGAAAVRHVHHSPAHTVAVDDQIGAEWGWFDGEDTPLIGA